MTSPHVLITGGARGIGFETAAEYAQQGASVSIVDIGDPELHAAVAAIEERSGTKVTGMVADLRRPEAVEDVVDAAWSRGPIDIVVNSAGIYPAIPLLSGDAHTWDQVYDINVRAPMLCIVAVAKRAKRDGRAVSIVNLSSTASMRARPGAAAYSSSKAALEMLTRAAALELGEFGIRVNAVSPGYVAVHSDVNPISDDYAELVSRNPLGRPGTTEDIAKAIMWISGPDAQWVTGSILRVDGGSSTGSSAMPLSWDKIVT